MGLIINKLFKIIKHSFDSNSLVYRCKKALIQRHYNSENLPNYDSARCKILALRPEFKISLPSYHDQWPSVPVFDISVVVPCYNVEQYVQDALNSILSQKCNASFEVIAVDDGSTDGTCSILHEIAKKDNRVRVVCQKNKGFSGARNTGIQQIKGSTIVFVDSDDLLAPGALQALYNALKYSGADYVTGTYTYIDDNGHSLPIGKKRPCGVAWGRIFDREIWRELEFPEGLWFEDTLFAYMIAPRFKESCIDDIVYSYRKRMKSITATSLSSKRSVDTYFVTEVMLSWLNEMNLIFDESIYAQTLYQLGPLLLNRTPAQNDYETKCIFVMASELLKVSFPNGGNIPSSEKWNDLERALLETNYRLWRLASISI